MKKFLLSLTFLTTFAFLHGFTDPAEAARDAWKREDLIQQGKRDAWHQEQVRQDDKRREYDRQRAKDEQSKRDYYRYYYK